MLGGTSHPTTIIQLDKFGVGRKVNPVAEYVSAMVTNDNRIIDLIHIGVNAELLRAFTV